MKKVTSLDAFRKIGSREEWKRWILEYKNKYKADLEGNFFMDRYSIYDFARSPEVQHAGLEKLIAFGEYEEYYVLKYEAEEWIDFNVVRALPYYGTKAPVILDVDYINSRNKKYKPITVV